MSNRNHLPTVAFSALDVTHRVLAPFSSLAVCTSSKVVQERGSLVRILVSVLAIVCVAGVVPSVVSAKQARLFAGSFGGASSVPANPYPLSLNGNGRQKINVAVDGLTHDVYVTDGANHRVEKFDASGSFLSMLGLEVNKTAVEESATRAAEENICPAAGHPTDVCQAGKEGSTPGAFDSPGLLAVDNSSGESKGDLYVGDYSRIDLGSTDRVEKFDASGQPVLGWGEAGHLDGSSVFAPPAPVAGPFRQLDGIAVDVSGNLWVSAGVGGGDTRTFEFRDDSSFVTGWSRFIGEITVDFADNVYFNDDGVVRKTDAAGNDLGSIAPSRTEVTEDAGREQAPFQVRGLNVDSATNDIYLDGSEGTPEYGIVKRYDSSCHPVLTLEEPEPGCVPVEVFGTGLLSGNTGGMTVDPGTEVVYVADDTHVTAFSLLTVPDVATGPPVSPTHVSATLTGTVNPSGVELNGGAEGCRFEWGETNSYGHVVACDKTAAQIGTGSEPVEVHADITGLQTGRTYHYRLVASNPNDVNANIKEPSVGADLAFGPPSIENASAVSVSATTATLEAQVNPNDLDTRVRVEYGSEAGIYSQSTGEVDAGSGGSVQNLRFNLANLASGAIYHYRVVAENVLGEGVEAAVGPDHAFTTQLAGTFPLPDGRAWELVSPPNKHGAAIGALEGRGVIEAASGGNTVTYLANAPTESEPANNPESQVQVLSARAEGRWASRDIGTHHDVAVGTELGGDGPENVFFSSDLSLAFAETTGPLVPEVSPEASEETPYIRTDFALGEPGSVCAVSCYEPLVTGTPGVENVPAGTKFAAEGKCRIGGSPCGPELEGANGGGEYVVLKSRAALVEGAPASALYEWSAGQLKLVSILPGAAGPAPESALPNLGSFPKPAGSARNAISNDGSRIVWSENKTDGNNHLYLRDVTSEETVQLDGNKGGSGKGIAQPVFEAASSDGSVIFFTDEQQLTPDSGAGQNSSDLYRCEVLEGESGELECRLTDLTPVNGRESADVQPGMPGAGEDGSTVYFFAGGVLTDVPNARGEYAVPGSCAQTIGSKCNLYMRRGAKTVFIAVMAELDVYDWSNDLSDQPARVSPNGEWFEFMSQRSLTGYDNRDVATGAPAAEVYLYSAAANTLACASCNPTGARPNAEVYTQLLGSIDRGSGDVAEWVDYGFVAANVPGWTAVGSRNRYQDRYLSDSGRLFFNAVGGLAPQDANGTVDVYEFEPVGVGDCGEASQTFSPRSDGCVALVSSGTSGKESVFLDASESGDDVFFLTAAQLSYRDTDTAYDVYDAHVGGGESKPVKPVECQGDACQGFVAAPNDPTPGSLIFSGPGNPVPLLSPPVSSLKKTVKCAKGKKLSHGRCVKKAKKHKAQAMRSKRAGHKRGVRR